MEESGPLLKFIPSVKGPEGRNIQLNSWSDLSHAGKVYVSVNSKQAKPSPSSSQTTRGSDMQGTRKAGCDFKDRGFGGSPGGVSLFHLSLWWEKIIIYIPSSETGHSDAWILGFLLGGNTMIQRG